MGNEVSPTRTPIPAPTLLEGLGRSHMRLFQQYPTIEFCRTIMGQCYSECGDGAHNCWCWDIGNVQARTGGQYNFCTLHGAWEIVNGQRVNQAEHFRAFDSMEEGLDQHLTFLHTHYPTAFLAAMSGDAVAFAHELKIHGYYSAPEADYARNVAWFMQRYASLPPCPWQEEAVAAAQPAAYETETNS